ncbi:MAG: hypothetical protein NTW65_05155 [Deltaproteobacteria bacterium]|nr:hypothetical protein [Deltaproteobacteria bacterium]
MLNFNFMRVVTFIVILLLLFAPSVYDPSVYAKMKAIDEDELSKIEGQAGITISLGLSANANVTVASLTGAGTNAINLPLLTINGDSAAGKFGISTNLLLDVGSSGTKTWLFMNGIALPSTASNGINLSAVNVNVVAGGNSRTLGNLTVNGLYMGRDVTIAGTTHNYTTTPLWMQLSQSSGGSGLEGYMTQGGYTGRIQLTYRDTPRSFDVQGLYIYAATPGTYNASEDWTTWVPNGNMNIGGSSFTTYWQNGDIRGSIATIANVDIGRSATANVLRLKLPMMTTIKVRSMQLESGRSWGPICLDNVIFYRQEITLKHL